MYAKRILCVGSVVIATLLRTVMTLCDSSNSTTVTADFMTGSFSQQPVALLQAGYYSFKTTLLK
jgi:hypothetical protein